MYNKEAIYKEAKRIHAPGFFEQQEDALNEIWQWFKSRDLTFTLSGYAGTGKTHIMNHIVNILITKDVVVTAPTHKALRVLENTTRKKGMTIQSLCGLRPDVDVAEYDIENPQFKVIGEQKMKDYKLVIVDECSMVNPGLFNLLTDTAKAFKTKLLFVGDHLQIPYVEKVARGKHNPNRISPSFTDTNRQFNLTQIVRQEKGNPLLELFSLIRSDLINETTNFYQYILTNRGNINADGNGFVILNRVDFENKATEMFASDNFSKDINYVRLITYTNDSVRYWNTYIRQTILNNPSQMITVNDMFTAYRTVFDEYKSPIIVNSEDYIVNNMRYYVADNKLACYCVTLRSMFDNKVTPMFKIVDYWDEANMEIFSVLINAIHYKALTGTDRSRWYKYFRFKDIHLTMVDFALDKSNKSRIVGKDLDYGYAITSHKSQGSTFDNVLVDLDNIIYFTTQNGYRIRRDPKEALKLLYVALSRARHCAYLKL